MKRDDRTHPAARQRGGSIRVDCAARPCRLRGRGGVDCAALSDRATGPQRSTIARSARSSSARAFAAPCTPAARSSRTSATARRAWSRASPVLVNATWPPTMSTSSAVASRRARVVSSALSAHPCANRASAWRVLRRVSVEHGVAAEAQRAGDAQTRRRVRSAARRRCVDMEPRHRASRCSCRRPGDDPRPPRRRRAHAA